MINNPGDKWNRRAGKICAARQISAPAFSKRFVCIDEALIGRENQWSSKILLVARCFEQNRHCPELLIAQFC